MRYLLPAGMTSVSVGHEQFHADEDGHLVVPDDAKPHVHEQLQSRHLWSLVVAPPASTDEPIITAVAPVDPIELKRRMVSLLEGLGLSVPADAVTAFLRAEIVRALGDEIRRVAVHDDDKAQADEKAKADKAQADEKAKADKAKTDEKAKTDDKTKGKADLADTVPADKAKTDKPAA